MGESAVDADRLFAVDLDPGRLADELRRPVGDLAERAQDLYAELLTLCREHGAPSGEPIDIGPLAEREDLTIRLLGTTPLVGAEAFPPGRIVRRR